MATSSISSYLNFDRLPEVVGSCIMSYVSLQDGYRITSTNKKFRRLYQTQLKKISSYFQKMSVSCFERMTAYLDYRSLIRLETSHRRLKELTSIGWKAVRKRHYLEYDWEHLANDVYKHRKSAVLGINLFHNGSLSQLKDLFPQYLGLMEVSPVFDNYFASEDLTLPLPSSFGGNLLIQSFIELETQEQVNNSQVLSCLHGAIKAKATFAPMLVLYDSRFTLEEKITLVKASSLQGDERALERFILSNECNQLTLAEVKRRFRDTDKIYPSALFFLFQQIQHDPRRKEYLNKALIGYGDKAPLNLLLTAAFEFQREKDEKKTQEITNRIFSSYSFEVISSGVFSSCQLVSFLDKPKQKILREMTIAMHKNANQSISFNSK